MPLIFSYGSLQDERVQLSTFGRRLDGWKDEVLGFDLTSATVDDPAAVELSGKNQHANLVAADRQRRVAGTVFEITDGELRSVDEYEAVFSYTRTEAALASGGHAWVYVHAGTTHAVRPATPSDIPALIGLMAEFYAESGFPLPEANARAAFAALLSDARLGGVWIAWNGGQPIGHVVLTVGFSMEYGTLRGFVDDLFVRPSARGRGVAGALLEAVVSDCHARGVRALLVEVGPDNDAGRRAYDKAGFADTGHLLLARPLGLALHEAGSESFMVIRTQAPPAFE